MTRTGVRGVFGVIFVPGEFDINVGKLRLYLRAGDRTRTGDVQLGKLAFYQLNYAREELDCFAM